MVPPPLESHKLSLTGDKFSGNRESQQTRLASYLPAVTTPMLHSKAKKLQNFCRRTKFNGTHISQMQKERERGFPSPEFLHLSCITSTKHDLNEDGIVYWKSCCQVEAGFVLKNGVEDYKLKLLRHLKFILRAGEKITDKKHRPKQRNLTCLLIYGPRVGTSQKAEHESRRITIVLPGENNLIFNYRHRKC